MLDLSNIEIESFPKRNQDVRPSPGVLIRHIDSGTTIIVDKFDTKQQNISEAMRILQFQLL